MFFGFLLYIHVIVVSRFLQCMDMYHARAVRMYFQRRSPRKYIQHEGGTAVMYSYIQLLDRIRLPPD